ncbi:MAG: hypothetical protein ACXABD_13250 [Candidatus Thorarchaeota archaeon]|jgi:hypothetical protein
MDFLFDINIGCDTLIQLEDLENTIELNADIIADWDIESPYIYEDDGGIVSLQFSSAKNLSKFVEILKENGYEIE